MSDQQRSRLDEKLDEMANDPRFFKYDEVMRGYINEALDSGNYASVMGVLKTRAEPVSTVPPLGEQPLAVKSRTAEKAIAALEVVNPLVLSLMLGHQSYSS